MNIECPEYLFWFLLMDCKERWDSTCNIKGAFSAFTRQVRKKRRICTSTNRNSIL